jgi:hypothetical protein
MEKGEKEDETWSFFFFGFKIGRVRGTCGRKPWTLF